MTETKSWTEHDLFKDHFPYINSSSESDEKNVNIAELNEQIQFLQSKYDKAIQLREEEKEKEKERMEEIKSSIKELGTDSIAQIIFEKKVNPIFLCFGCFCSIFYC